MGMGAVAGSNNGRAAPNSAARGPAAPKPSLESQTLQSEVWNKTISMTSQSEVGTTAQELCNHLRLVSVRNGYTLCS